MMFDRWFCFFFKQKTAYEMRISDWSSDVCSSDLLGDVHQTLDPRLQLHEGAVVGDVGDAALEAGADRMLALGAGADDAVGWADDPAEEIGRASCWASVCQYG